MQERVFAETFDPEGNHLPVPHLYLIGLDKPANFAGSLGVTGELLQLAIDMFQGSHDRHYVMQLRFGWRVRLGFSGTFFRAGMR